MMMFSLRKFSCLFMRRPCPGPPTSLGAAGGLAAAAGNKKTDAAMASVLWSEQRDLNPRPPRPERGALPTALCPEKPQRQGCGLVGDERIELPQVESESTALPLCKSPSYRIELPQVESESTALPLCKSPSYRRRRRTLAAADKGYYTLSGRGCQLFFSTGGGRPGWWHLLQKVRKKP